ncbi:hypothetical protein HNY73_007295 [Argiope bruennichi]|uniref:Uncharacterized protein n=1 Tax=Argiope bruennichi TaxID=94029 RepID=A0A8T0FDI4_ARGBR|nr:hypothetical protein HNY73_007295 [Argiope bruennichi]
MGTRRYYFPKFDKNHPMFYVARTSRQMVAVNDQIIDVFKKYAKESYPESPRQILYLMTRHNESLFEAIESDSNSSSESSSPRRKQANVSSLKRKKLPFDDSAKFANLESEGSIKVMEKDNVQESTSPNAKAKLSENPDTTEVIQNVDLKRPAPTVKDGTEESSLAKRPKLTDTADTDIPGKQTENLESEGSIKTMEMDYTQESTSSSAKIKMSGDSDTTEVIQNVEFQRPVTPLKDGTEESTLAKIPKLTENDTADIDTPAKQNETLIHSVEDNKMDISPIKSHKMDDSQSEGCEVMTHSPDQNKLPEKIRLLMKTIPVMEKDEIEIDMSSKSNENLERTETEIEDLDDDPSLVENVRKAVEDRLKADTSLERSKDNISPLKENISNRSTRRSRRIYSPGKDTEKILGSDDPDIISTHPNVLEYLKVRFTLVQKYRHKYMVQIYESLKAFQGDLLFLYYYAKTASLMVNNTPIEDKEYFTENLKSLTDGLVKNVKRLTDKLRLLLKAINSDIPFWSNGLKKIRKLTSKNEPLISKENDSEKSVELLRRYESDLRKIWEQMDSRILLKNGLRSSLLEMSADYAKVAEDYVKYLVMVEILKPSLISASEGVQEK